jgi:hypothetical protein
VAVQEVPQKGMVYSSQRLLIHHYEPDWSALGFSGGVKECAFQIRRAQGIISDLAQLGSEQGTVPLVRHHQQHSWGKINDHDSELHIGGRRGKLCTGRCA